MELFEKFENFMREIANNPNIKIEKNNIDEIKNRKPFISERALLRAREAMGMEISEEVFQYGTIASLGLKWTASGGWDFNDEIELRYLKGGYEIDGLLYALGGRSTFWKYYNDDSRFWKTDHQLEAKAVYETFLPKLNVFQSSVRGESEASAGTYGCILCEKGVYPCPVYFYDSGMWFEMNMSVEQYYDAMLKCKGVHCWQYFYVDTDKIMKELGNFNPRYLEYGAYYFNGPKGGASTDEYRDGTVTSTAHGVLIQMQNIIYRFPKLFPDVDLTYFKERCNALEKALNNK